MNYFASKLENIIKETIKGEYSIKPVGHHTLGRHYVYAIISKNDSDYILKIYGKPFRLRNEIISLELLKDYIDCPRVKNKSNTSSETEWLLMNKIDGITLDKVWDNISDVNKIHIITKMGEMLGKIHSSFSYDYYGNWCNELYNKNDFIEYRKANDNAVIQSIITQHLPEEELLLLSYYELIKFYQKINDYKIPRLCHHDFSARNILVVQKNSKWEISGIIDFEHCYPDDPDIDFTDLFQTIFLNEPNLTEYFFKGYSQFMDISDDMEIKMKYYLINKGLVICSWAHNCTIDYYYEGIELLKKLIPLS